MRFTGGNIINIDGWNDSSSRRRERYCAPILSKTNGSSVRYYYCCVQPTENPSRQDACRTPPRQVSANRFRTRSMGTFRECPVQFVQSNGYERAVLTRVSWSLKTGAFMPLEFDQGPNWSYTQSLKPFFKTSCKGSFAVKKWRITLGRQFYKKCSQSQRKK